MINLKRTCGKLLRSKRTIATGALLFGYTYHKDKINRFVNQIVGSKTKADTDIFSDENIMPEFDIDLSEKPVTQRNKYDWSIPTRGHQIQQMMKEDNIYDILVIGGGCNGAGVALDAASRGLSVALIDKNDFAAGTSSKSTKLAHGGVRYLEQIVKREGDIKMSYHLLKEALRERNYFLDCNPFMNREIKIVIPDESLLMTLFWNYPGTIVYHLLYLFSSMKNEFNNAIAGPKVVFRRHMRKLFPSLKHLRNYYGTMLHEGQFNDSRQCIMSILTSAIDQYDKGMKGANIANYVSFTDFVKNEDGRITGAVVKDELNDKEFIIHSRAVVNCAGVFADSIRLADDPKARLRMCASRGTHIIIDNPNNSFIPDDTGILLANTSDGRLVFMLPYFGKILAGTTDDMQPIDMYPEPQEKDVEFIKKELRRVFGPDFDITPHIKSTFAGLRPLCISGGVAQEDYEETVKNLKSKDICRNHVIETSPSGLVSLLGGKWTSYRAMGEECVDSVIRTHSLKNFKNEKSTAIKLKLLGGYSKAELQQEMIIRQEDIVKRYLDQMTLLYDIPLDISKRLLEMYGTASIKIVKRGLEIPKHGDKSKEKHNSNIRLHDDLSVLESEIYYAMDNELAVRADDVINRRLGIAFQSQQIANEVADKVVDIMAQHLKWNSKRVKEEKERAKARISVI